MKKNNNIFIGYFAICCYACLSGISFAWTKRLLLCGIPVFTIVLIRLIIGATFLLSALKLSGNLEPIRKKDILSFICLALGEPVVYFIGEDFGMKYVEASFASVIIAMIPIFIAFVIPIVYRTKLKKSILIGAFTSMIGVCLMSFNKYGFAFDYRGLLFLLLALASAVWFNVFLQKLLKSYGAFTVTAYMNFIGAVLYIPLFFFFDFKNLSEIHFSLQSISDLLCLGILCSAGSYGLYSLGAKKLSVEKVSVFNNVAPIITIFASVFMGMETFTLRKVSGIFIVVLGVIISQDLFSKKQNTETSVKKT
ncbi:MAG: DMT family transporter [Bacteroidales bacterium]|nr:DMT family transporter [Bacteroidales bacterium]